MDNRAYEANAAATPPTAPVAPSSGYPKPGNPATSDPATKPGPFWVYAIGEELRNVVTGAGLAPDLNDLTQLRAAIVKMISDAAKAIRIDNAVFEASVANGEAVRWDSTNSRFDEAIADGTTNNQAVGFADVTNSRVYVYGETPALFAGLTPGARYYLNASTAGAVTAAKPADVIVVGVAKSATTMFVDIDAIPADTSVLLDRSQTIISGGTDASGYANFLSAGAGLTLNIAATTEPLRIAFAAGFTQSGNLDFLGTVNADTTLALTDNATNYVYYDRAADGTLTKGLSTLQWEAGFAHPASPATDQHSYLRHKRKMYRWSGAAWEEKQRVFLGEAVAAAGAITSVKTYALCGEYRSQLYGLAASTPYSVNHNLGVYPDYARVTLVNQIADQGYSPGDVVHDNFTQHNSVSPLGYANSTNRSTVTTITSNSVAVIPKAGGQPAPIAVASWKLQSIISRGW
jgi:hypothetical protein